jgi:hypothetical protein
MDRSTAYSKNSGHVQNLDPMQSTLWFVASDNCREEPRRKYGSPATSA